MGAEGPGPTAPSRPTAVPADTTRAQRVAGALGGLLVVLGLLGFVASGSFATSGPVRGGSLAGVEVNGVSNVMHLAAGLLLALAAGRRGPAARACGLLGLFFAVAFFSGLGSAEVFGAMPVNAGTEALWALLAVALLAGRAGGKDRRDVLQRNRVAVAEREGPPVVGPGSGHVGGPRAAGPRVDRRLSLRSRA